MSHERQQMKLMIALWMFTTMVVPLALTLVLK